MNHEQIESLASVLKDAPSLTEVEIKHAGATLRLRREKVLPGSPASAPPMPGESLPAASAAPPTPSERSEPQTLVRASVVGIFHALSGKPVGAGDTVKAGQILGHIESMRLMNDCTTPVAGVIEQLLVQDGQPVAWGQPLFEILPGGSR